MPKNIDISEVMQIGGVSFREAIVYQSGFTYTYMVPADFSGSSWEEIRQAEKNFLN